METGLKLFMGAVSSLILCIGLYLLIYESRSVLSMFDIVRDQMKDEQLYQQYYTEDIEEVSYTELVATLLTTLEYDIVIDAVMIKRIEYSIDNLEGYNLRKGNYQKQYQYDENGNIQLITYTSKG